MTKRQKKKKLIIIGIFYCIFIVMQAFPKQTNTHTKSIETIWKKKAFRSCLSYWHHSFHPLFSQSAIAMIPVNDSCSYQIFHFLSTHLLVKTITCLFVILLIRHCISCPFFQTIFIDFFSFQEMRNILLTTI